MLSGKILQARGWPQGKVIGLAKIAGQKLEDAGVERETAQGSAVITTRDIGINA